MSSARQVVDELQEEMVLDAERLAHSLNLAASEETQVKTQASRAIEVARASGSLALFINWLRYQAARETRQPGFWSRKARQHSLAEDLSTALQGHCRQVQQRLEGSSTEARRAAEMRAVVLYLGYFRRALVAAKLLDRLPNVTATSPEGGKRA